MIDMVCKWCGEKFRPAEDEPCEYKDMIVHPLCRNDMRDLEDAVKKYGSDIKEVW